MNARLSGHRRLKSMDANGNGVIQRKVIPMRTLRWMRGSSPRRAVNSNSGSCTPPSIGPHTTWQQAIKPVQERRHGAEDGDGTLQPFWCFTGHRGPAREHRTLDRRRSWCDLPSPVRRAERLGSSPCFLRASVHPWLSLTACVSAAQTCGSLSGRPESLVLWQVV